MVNLIKKYKYALLLLIVVGFVGIANYQPGTFLTGWDTLQTELYPSLAVKRAFFAVWQEYQSLGLVGGMAHGADLIRALGVWIMSFFLPQSLIRYVFHLGMWFVGGVGAFTLIKYARNNRHPELVSGSHDSTFPFLGALFYMLNFATIQLFYLPFEPFSIFFASLPWLVWIFISVSSRAEGPERSRRARGLESSKYQLSSYLALFLINLLATPSFYVQTLFIVYMIILGILGVFYMFQKWPTHGSATTSGRVTNPPLHFSPFPPALELSSPRALLIPLAIIIAANLFWLLPQAYFLKTNSNVVSNAKINQIATVDVQYQNKARSDIPSIASFKGFYVDLVGKKGTFLFETWNKYNSTPGVVWAGIAIFGVILLGFTKKNTYRLPFATVYMVCGFMLLFATAEVDLGIFSQIFRSPFTKFAIPFALFSSYFFAEGVSRIRDVILKRRLVIATALILILITSFPVFTGNFFSSDMKVLIPKQYFSVFEYFKSKPAHDRIALLPDATFWGWFNYQWGYTGSGFLWYGIKQPIISRTFDV